MNPIVSNPAAAFRHDLDRDEQLLWTGTPKQGITLQAGDALMIPFSLMWGGFAIFWEYTVLSSGGPNFFALWGIPFVAVGIYLIIGRFFYDAARRKKTFYALTDKRAIIRSGVFQQSTKSINLRTLSDITLNEKPDGSGTIVLGPEVASAYTFRTGWPGSHGKIAPSLEMISGVRKVYNQITSLQNT